MRKFIKINSENEVVYCHYDYDSLSDADKKMIGEGIIIDEIPEQPSTTKIYKMFYTPENGFEFVVVKDVPNEIEALKLMVADLALNQGGML